MTTLSNITIRNFLSVGNITQAINLCGNGLTLILGENVDSGGGNNRNGVGKSTILQAISYGLYGEPLTKIRKDNLVNNINNKGMLVKIELESHGKKYVIERGRKPGIFKLFVDGAEFKKKGETGEEIKNDAQGENKHTQAEITRIVGMTHMMFKHVVALNTYTKSFMEEDGPKQRSIIEELLGIMQLSERAASLKNLMDGTKELLRDEEAKIKANTEANARIEQAIERAKAEAGMWKLAHQKNTDAMIARAEELSSVDIDYEISLFDQLDTWNQQQKEIDDLISYARKEIETHAGEIHRLHREIGRYKEEASKVDSGEITRLETQMRRYLVESEEDISAQINRLTTEINRKRKEAEDKAEQAEKLGEDWQALQDQLDNPNSHTCTTCGQGLEGTDHLDKIIARLTSQRDDITVRIEKLMAASESCLTDVVSINEEIEQTKIISAAKKEEAKNKAIAIRQDIEVAKATLEEQKTTAAARVLELQEMLEKVNEKVAENRAIVDEGNEVLKAIGDRPRCNYTSREAVWKIQQDREVLLSQIESELEKENPHLSKIDGLKSTVAEINYDLVNEYTLRLKHEAFLYKLLTAKDSFIRKKIVDQNLAFLNNRMNHYLDKIGLPHEVAFLPDLTVEVNLLGRELDFEQLSRGEMNRVILATFWSFRDVWESLNHSFNLLFVDECLDFGMDDSGAELALTMLQSMARDRKKNVFLISHKETLVGKADRVMLVRKENHFTTLDADYQLT